MGDFARFGIYDKILQCPHIRGVPRFRNSGISEFRNPREIRKGRAAADATWRDLGRSGRRGEICQDPHSRGIPTFRNTRISEFLTCPGDSDKPGNVWPEVARLGRYNKIRQEPHIRGIQKSQNPRISEFRNFRDVRKDRETYGKTWGDFANSHS